MVKRKILQLNFNQDQGLFSCCMTTGLRIYNVDPLEEKEFYSDNVLGTIQRCEMLNRSNYLALIPGGPRPKYSKNSVLIYDDDEKLLLGQLPFSSKVINVKLCKNKLITVLENCIYIHRFDDDIELIATIDTRKNIRGLCDITPKPTEDRQLMIFPGHKIGSLRILDLSSLESNVTSAPVSINAHQSELAYMVLNQEGTLAATASIKGTLIRVWNIIQRTQIIELRRGSDQAILHCINFSGDSKYLCCSSDKGTVHIFALKDSFMNKKYALSNILGDSQRAFTSFVVPPECACICGFDTDTSIVAVCLDGTFYKYSININGTCKREAFDIFLNVSEDGEYLNGHL